MKKQKAQKHRKNQPDAESMKAKMIEEAEQVFWKAHKKNEEEAGEGGEDEGGDD